MKTEQETRQYKHLRAKMIAKCDAIGVSWARYYANILDLGGNHSEQYLRNFFIKDEKRFNNQQLATIYNDLEEFESVKPYSQCEIKNEVLKILSEMGILSSKMEQTFDENENISIEEASRLLPSTRKMKSLAEQLHIRLEETKAQG